MSERKRTIFFRTSSESPKTLYFYYTMDKFLQQCRTHLDRVNDDLAVCIVLGNEACDLDSAVSALAYAQFLNQSQKHCTINIPVINVTRSDFQLKTEVVYFLGKFGINFNNLIFRNEIDLTSLHSRGKLKLVLVDHNVLCHSDGNLESSVVEVIDHHKLERPTGIAEMLVEPVGSCCTLVASVILSNARGLLDSELATLLLGTIILDTVNFSPTAKRAAPKDVEVADQLQQLVPSDVSRDQMFTELQNAKENVSGLNTEQLLRKDVKILHNERSTVAVCSLPLLGSKLLKKYQNETEAVSKLSSFCAAHDYAALVLVGIEIEQETSEIKRDVIVFSSSSSLKNTLCRGLEQHNQPSLDLERASPNSDFDGMLIHYHQGNVTASRKVILPVLRSAMSSQGGRSSPLPTPRLPNGIHGAASQLLSVTTTTDLGSSVEGSSQNSSTVNSCPYTPSNSCAEDGDSSAHNEAYQSHRGLLDASSLLAERLDSRRFVPTTAIETQGALQDVDYHEDALFAVGETTYPFTPKNSFVDGAFEQAYQRFVLNHVDTEAAIMEKLSREKFFQGFEGDEHDG